MNTGTERSLEALLPTVEHRADMFFEMCNYIIIAYGGRAAYRMFQDLGMSPEEIQAVSDAIFDRYIQKSQAQEMT